MGLNRCGIESKRVLWLISLLFGFVVAIQYFELPYKDSMLSLISTGKGFFSFPDSTRDVVGFKQIHPFIISPSSNAPSIPQNISIADSPISSDFPFSVNISPSDSSVREVTVPLAPANELDTSLLAPSPSPTEVLAPPPMNFVNQNLTSNNTNPEIAKSSSDSPYQKKRKKKARKGQVDSILSVPEMYDALLESRESSFSKTPLWPSSADKELLDARIQIENASIITKHPGLSEPIFRNLSMFARSYEIMEQRLKVYIYKEGSRPVFHQPRLKGIYASEGWFMKHMEGSNHFVTKDPNEAHLFYLPYSSQLLVDKVYVKDSHSFKDINNFLKIYIESIISAHPFWNRTYGEDHFLVACHDWAPIETRRLMANCIRAICNSDVKEGFKFGKDVSLPETKMQLPLKPKKEIGGSPPSKRKILAFFAGQMHGYLRPILLKNWENKDPEMKIVGKMRRGYDWHMKNSKYCICAKGYEVNSPRVVEAIIYGCVPVILSDNFVPPFLEILNWHTFAVFVAEKDIPNLKKILVSISEEKYVVMQRRVNEVRKHFVWNDPPQKYDIFHMILHSIWYNRVFRLPFT